MENCIVLYLIPNIKRIRGNYSACVQHETLAGFLRKRDRGNQVWSLQRENNGVSTFLFADGSFLIEVVNKDGWICKCQTYVYIELVRPNCRRSRCGRHKRGWGWRNDRNWRNEIASLGSHRRWMKAVGRFLAGNGGSTKPWSGLLQCTSSASLNFAAAAAKKKKMLIAIRRVDISGRIFETVSSNILSPYLIRQLCSHVKKIKVSKQNGNGDGICSIGWNKKGSRPNQRAILMLQSYTHTHSGTAAVMMPLAADDFFNRTTRTWQSDTIHTLLYF